MRKSKLRFWGFLAPSLIAFCIVVIIPTCIGFFYSLTNWNGIVGSDIKFVGFQNFFDIVTRDDSFVHAFLFTALFSVCAVVLVNLVGFALALLVTQKFRGATLLRGIFFMPNMIGGLLLGFTWQFIFISIFEAFSKKTGIAAFSGWLSNPETGFIGLLILTVWQMSGYMMIVYFAQIQQIPESVKEAARIDGASELYTFHRIAIPIMSPGIATMSIMGFIGGWNAYLLPMIILNKNKKFTLPVMMATLRASTDITANQGAIYIAVEISIIQILLVYAFISKKINSSISAGAVKE